MLGKIRGFVISRRGCLTVECTVHSHAHSPCLSWFVIPHVSHPHCLSSSEMLFQSSVLSTSSKTSCFVFIVVHVNGYICFPKIYRGRKANHNNNNKTVPPFIIDRITLQWVLYLAPRITLYLLINNILCTLHNYYNNQVKFPTLHLP